jgi:hypothetical protein
VAHRRRLHDRREDYVNMAFSTGHARHDRTAAFARLVMAVAASFHAATGVGAAGDVELGYAILAQSDSRTPEVGDCTFRRRPVREDRSTARDSPGNRWWYAPCYPASGIRGATTRRSRAASRGSPMSERR